MNDHFTVQNISPSANRITETFGAQWIFKCDHDNSESMTDSAVSSLYHGMSPHVYASESVDGGLDIVFGGVFLRSIHHFLHGNSIYPVDGFIDEFRGKAFKDLPRRVQRKLSEATFDLTIFVLFSANDGKEQAYKEMVKIAHRHF